MASHSYTDRNNIKLHCRKAGCENVRSMSLTWDRVQWRVLVQLLSPVILGTLRRCFILMFGVTWMDESTWSNDVQRGKTGSLRLLSSSARVCYHWCQESCSGVDPSGSANTELSFSIRHARG
jgi:hypothetical protein